MGGRGVPLEVLRRSPVLIEKKAARVLGVDVQILLRAAVLPPGGLDQREHRAAQILFLAGLGFHPGDRSSHKRGRRILGTLR